MTFHLGPSCFGRPHFFAARLLDDPRFFQQQIGTNLMRQTIFLRQVFLYHVTHDTLMYMYILNLVL
jgi:hypothetical protein